jgi:hypothetical protein
LASATALIENEQESDIGDEEAEEDQLVQKAEEEIANRLASVGEDYPFRIDDRGRALCFIQPVTGAGSIYLFCLYVSHAFDPSIISKEDAPEVNNEIRDLFQACATMAAGGFVFAPAMSFGWPRPDGSSDLKALHKVYGIFGEESLTKKRARASKKVKDNGIGLLLGAGQEKSCRVRSTLSRRSRAATIGRARA